MISSSRNPSPDHKLNSNPKPSNNLVVKVNDSPLNPPVAQHINKASIMSKSKFNKDISKTLPINSVLQSKAEDMIIKQGFTMDLNVESPSDKRNSLSPESRSRGETYQPGGHDSDNSSMEVQGGLARDKDLNRSQKKRKNIQDMSRKKEEARVLSLLNKKKEERDAYLAEKIEKCKSLKEGSNNMRANIMTKSKIPTRRVQSILKKSSTNKRSVDTSPSRDCKKVQFNKFKQVLTYNRE